MANALIKYIDELRYFGHNFAPMPEIVAGASVVSWVSGSTVISPSGSLTATNVVVSNNVGNILLSGGIDQQIYSVSALYVLSTSAVVAGVYDIQTLNRADTVV